VRHQVHDEISLELGRRVAARLQKDPSLIQFARGNLARWLERNAHAPGLVRCYREWQDILDRPLADICQVLVADNEESRRLRQNSPFAGLLSPAEVWSIKAAIRDRYATSTA
jgi:hypothetical protein